ncbi:MAG: ammonium transporter [Patescibacteria group bacterium]
MPTVLNSGDTAWMLVASGLVMLMTPGLALFYGGMVRKKNVLSTIMQSFVALAIVSLLWVFYGYSLSFGPDVHGIIGNLDWAFLKGVGTAPNVDYAPTIPHLVFMLFQMKFAVITPALITGAFAERFKFKTYLLFLILWSTFVYFPLAHWVWGIDGWIRNLGALDFAGGLVVHISAGVAALVAAIMVGKRKTHHEPIKPHNVTMTFLGTALLWFGWFGFNAGSALAANELTASAFTATHLGSAAAALSWMFAEWIHKGKPTLLGTASGAVAGLVAITPASGFVTPMASVVIGLVAGVVCYFAVNLKSIFGYDDALDVVGVHAVGGIVGAVLTGFFASKLVNAAGNDGLFYGNASLVGTQLLSVLIVVVFSFVATYIILKLLDVTIGLRASEDKEMHGLDVSEHGEIGYE